jgi:hypothetical protein
LDPPPFVSPRATACPTAYLTDYHTAVEAWYLGADHLVALALPFCDHPTLAGVGLGVDSVVIHLHLALVFDLAPRW